MSFLPRAFLFWGDSCFPRNSRLLRMGSRRSLWIALGDRSILESHISIGGEIDKEAISEGRFRARALFPLDSVSPSDRRRKPPQSYRLSLCSGPSIGD